MDNEQKSGIININLKPNERIAFCCDIHFDNNAPVSRVDDIQETIEKKMNDMYNKCIEHNVKHLFFEGDIFNRIQCSHEAVYRMGEILKNFIDKGIKLYTILGNHDILRNSLKDIERSPINLLFSFGLLEHINMHRPVVINKDILIVPVDYTEEAPRAVSNFKVNILLAHAFYDNYTFGGADHNIEKEWVETAGYNAIILGHDHEEHPITKVNKTYIIRSGSILRGTSNSYNFTRTPKFVILDDLYNINENTILNIDLWHKDYKDIASEYILNKKKLSSIKGLESVLNDLSDLAERLTNEDGNNTDRIYEIIQTDTKLPSECRTMLMHYISEA